MDFMNRAKEYAKSNIITHHGTSDVINEFSEEIKKMGGKIIDIGCGPGDVTYELLLPNVADDAVIVGADISRPMIDYARSHYKDEKRLSFIQLNIQTNPLPENLVGQFDNVLSFFCLHWCFEKELVMKNIYKLLRPGGKGLIMFPSHHYLFDVISQQQEDSEYTVYMKDVLDWMPAYQKLANPEETVRTNLENAGFKVFHCSKKWITYSWANLEAFIDLAMTVNPFADKIPDALEKQYRNDLGKKFANKFLSDEEKKDYRNCIINDRYTIVVAYFEK